MDSVLRVRGSLECHDPVEFDYTTTTATSIRTQEPWYEVWSMDPTYARIALTLMEARGILDKNTC